MRFEALKVGELARRTGLTVRTLHHYDEFGLLKPSLRTESGHRLYTAGDVARLQQVLSLRQLGFSLEEVGDCLDRPGFSPLEVISLHVARLREQIDLQRQLTERLEVLADHLRTAGEVSADEFLRTIKVMTMIEKRLHPRADEAVRRKLASRWGPKRSVPSRKPGRRCSPRSGPTATSTRRAQGPGPRPAVGRADGANDARVPGLS